MSEERDSIDSPFGREQYRRPGGWGYGRGDYPIEERRVVRGQRGGVERRFDLSREGRRRGKHAGKGPRDFRISDERILENVCERLFEDEYVDATHVCVEIRSGEITLRGRIESGWMRDRTEQIAAGVYGVELVRNELRI